jgi:LmbE family N-acetylglucosaminyl deacetylase
MQLPSFLRVLAIGAHPDDVEFFAGATVARLRDAGAQVAAGVQRRRARRSRPRRSRAVRRARQARAAAALDIDDWLWLAHPDGALAAGDPLRRSGSQRAARAPELVLAHDPRTLWTLLGDIAHPVTAITAPPAGGRSTRSTRVRRVPTSTRNSSAATAR